MKIKYIKMIDRHIGWVICVMLNLHYRLIRLLSVAKDESAPKKILIIKFFGMGSVILTQPAVAVVKGRYPLAKIYFLTFSNNKDILTLFGIIDYKLYVNLRPLHKFIIDTLRIIIYLRKERIDIVFDLEFFSRFTSIVAYLSGAKCRIEFYSEVFWRGNLYTCGVKFNPYFHVRKNFLRLVNEGRYGLCEAGMPVIKISHELRQHARKILMKHGVSEDDTRVCININAGELAAERRWPASYFVVLINKLSAYHIKYLMIGAKYDMIYVDDLISLLEHHSNIINLTGRLNVIELAGVLHESSLLITNDSGPLHLADAIGTPVVAFFGPETPVLYGPKDGHNLVFYKNAMCSPCLNVLNAKTVICTTDAQCMRDIKPDDVYKTIVDRYRPIFMPTKDRPNESPAT